MLHSVGTQQEHSTSEGTIISSAFLFRERRGGITDVPPEQTDQNEHVTQSSSLLPFTGRLNFNFPSFQKQKQTLSSLLIHWIPEEFKLPTNLEYDYEKSTLSHDKIMRILFLLAFSGTYTLIDVLGGDGCQSQFWHYFHIAAEWLVVSFLILATFLFPSNLFWQRGVSIVSILFELFALHSLNSSTMYRPVIVILVSFMMFPFSSTLLIGFYAILICIFPLICTLLQVHPYLIIQMWIILVVVVFCSILALLTVQKHDRQSFLLQHHLKLKKDEAAQEAHRMELLIGQMLPLQIARRLQEDFSSNTLGTNCAESVKLQVGKSLHSQTHIFLSRYKQSCRASIAFIRLVDFDSTVKSLTASESFIMLSEIFSLFDQAVEEHNLHRFKTVRQTYMFGGGAAFSEKQDYFHAVFNASKEIIQAVSSIKHSSDIQIGIASGDVVCGVIGDLKSRIHFDVWGNAVTLASRLTTYTPQRNSFVERGNCIHIESKYEPQVNLSSFHVEKEENVLLKGQNAPVDILRIFPIEETLSCHQTSQPDHPFGNWEEGKSHNASITKHIQNALVGHLDAYTEEPIHMPNHHEHYLSQGYTAFMDQIIGIMPEHLTAYRNSFLKALSLTLVFPFRYWKFYRLLLQNSFKRRVGSSRAIIFQCICLYCLGGAGDCLTMFLYSERDSFPASLQRVLSSYQSISMISWYSIALWRYAIGLSLLCLSSVLVFTPLYSCHYLVYDILTFISAVGIILAHTIKCSQLISNLLDQFILFLIVVCICNIHFSVMFKLLILAMVVPVFIWQNLISFADYTDFGYLTSAALLMSLVLIMCAHNSVVLHMKTIQHFLLSVGQRRETQQLRKQKDINNKVACSVLHRDLVERLEPSSRSQIVTDFAETITVCYADIVGFSQWSAQLTPQELVTHLDRLFSKFSVLAQDRNLNRLHIVGDCIVFIAGYPNLIRHHEYEMTRFACELLDYTSDYGEVEFRVGLHCGSALSGCLATSHIQWDMLGPTMTIGELMEQTGSAMKIHISKSVYIALKHHEDLCFERYPRLIEDSSLESPMQTYFVRRKQCSMAGK